MAEFDPVMHEHLRRMSNSDHCFGRNMQNEFLYLFSQRVLKEFVANIVKAKYYSLMLDCTPNIIQVAVELEFKCSEILKYKVGLQSTEAANFAFAEGRQMSKAGVV